jgi:hypothetical protein
MNRPRLRFPQHQIIPSRHLYDRDMLAVDLAAEKNRCCPEPQRLVNQPRAEPAGKLSNILPELSAGMKIATTAGLALAERVQMVPTRTARRGSAPVG